MFRRTFGALTLAALVATAGCTGKGSSSEPPKNLPPADQAVAQLATALAKGDVSSAPVVDAQLAEVDRRTIMAGMDGMLPTVAPEGTPSYDGETATAHLKQRLKLGAGTLEWTSPVTLHYADQKWRASWAPTIVHPDLSGTTRLRHTREVPKRASILGADGKALVEERTAYRVGVDKANLDKAKWAPTATTLAKVVKVDAAAYTKQVAAAGEQAFVPAITFREGQVPDAVRDITGVTVVPVKMPLAPSPTFAVAILGGAGKASPELVKQSKGEVEAEDVVGTSGLQKRYDAQLRGTVGHTIDVVVRKDGTEAPSANPSPSESSSATSAEASPSATPGQVTKQLYTAPAKPGTDLTTSLDLALQAKAEEVLAGQKGIASLAVVKVGTGDVLVAANSPASGANPDATFGRYAPGSTFKVVTSLALLRKGLAPNSVVPCTPTVEVNGRTFKNYSDFPAGATGNVPLATALANSCNTAFISQWQKVSPAELAEAAASLGVGVDHDAGFPAFYGSVPTDGDQTTRAANMIGQGTVEASPMAMAGLAASVASGKTVVPWLVASAKPTAKATPLSPAEASQLQQLMKGVVSNGSGRVLAGTMTGAKTGTAEFGTAKPPKTHAWMIAWNDKYAIAAMVNEGESGSKTAAPIIKAFLGAS